MRESETILAQMGTLEQKMWWKLKLRVACLWDLQVDKIIIIIIIINSNSSNNILNIFK